jgi:hypothetical protein
MIDRPSLYRATSNCECEIKSPNVYSPHIYLLAGSEGSVVNNSNIIVPRVSAARLFTLCKPPKMLVRGLFSFVHFRILWAFFFWPLTDPVCAQLIFYLNTRVFFWAKFCVMKKALCIYSELWSSFQNHLHKRVFWAHKTRYPPFYLL